MTKLKKHIEKALKDTVTEMTEKEALAAVVQGEVDKALQEMPSVADLFRQEAMVGVQLKIHKDSVKAKLFENRILYTVQYLDQAKKSNMDGDKIIDEAIKLLLKGFENGK